MATYKGLKPVYWCTDCETALAEAEIEYRDDTTNSIYVKFEVKDDKVNSKDFRAKFILLSGPPQHGPCPGIPQFH